MFILAGGRRTGKTGKMIEWFLADPMNRVIVTPNVQQANYIIKRIKSSMGDDYPFLGHIIHYQDARRFLAGSRNFEIGVENLDMIMYQMFSNSVDFATVSGVKFNAPSRKRWWQFW